VDRPGAGGGGTQLPNFPNRPGAGGGGTQFPIFANRPGAGGGGVERPTRPIVDRPGAGGGGVQWPNRPIVDRPGAGGGGVEAPWAERWQNRPDRPLNPDNRPDRTVVNYQPNRGDVNLGNRLVQNNVNNVNVNNWNQYNQQINANRNLYNRPANWNGPGYGGGAGWNYARPWYGSHAGWHTGFWNYGSARPALWFGAGALTGALASPGDSYVYSNPYYVEPASNTVVVQPTFDYSAPIPAPPNDQVSAAYQSVPTTADSRSIPDPSTEAPPASSTEDPTASEANKQFDASRAAFKGGDYAKAQELADKAVALLPSDATLHEFRALTLFAQKQYKDAVAGLYAVLAAGPGWNWQTMAGLYPDSDTYTKQLRELEVYTRAHPKEAACHFLQAYHYLVLGSKDAAVQQLKEVVQLEPKDKLSAALVQALTSSEVGPAGSPPQPGTGG
jgi:tetratricopeptide (TPR) repeat protein